MHKPNTSAVYHVLLSFNAPDILELLLHNSGILRICIIYSSSSSKRICFSSSDISFNLIIVCPRPGSFYNNGDNQIPTSEAQLLRQTQQGTQRQDTKEARQSDPNRPKPSPTFSTYRRSSRNVLRQSTLDERPGYP